MHPGDYISYDIHPEICTNPEIWTKAEQHAEVV
jgi:hypothetical protein